MVHFLELKMSDELAAIKTAAGFFPIIPNIYSASPGYALARNRRIDMRRLMQIPIIPSRFHLLRTHIRSIIYN